MAAGGLVTLDEMIGRLERALAYSPADSTEIAWIEVRRAWAVGGGREGAPEGEGAATPARLSGAGGQPRDRTLLIRVRQSGRTGLHRTGGAEGSELENAIREALAQARLAPPTDPEPLAPAGERRGEAATPPVAPPGSTAPAPAPASAPAPAPASADGAAAAAAGIAALHDPELAELGPATAAQLVERMAGRGERLRLDWLEGSVAVANSAGLRRGARVTAAGFDASCGSGPGAGRATGAARRLESLGAADTLDRARARHAPAGSALRSLVPEAQADARMVLSEQSVAALLELLNRHALSGAAMRDPSSCLRGRLGEALFAPCITLRDDATDPRALPFPFDLAGWPKRPVDLFVSGVFASPAVDPRLARELGRPPTPHALAPDETLASNLLLLPGDPAAPGGVAEAELLRSAEDGLFVGALRGVECFDLGRLRFRALALGVRQIAGGVLGPPLPDLLWEDSLPAVFARAQAVGDRPVAVASGDLLFGATAAPLLALRAGGQLRVVRPAAATAAAAA
jgi:predicted Zn-dependent protease